MVAELTQKSKNLYNIDYNLWVLETIKKLENRDFNNLDLENLIEEVTDLSRRDQRKLESLLTRLFEHLLKLAYWESETEYNQNHWRGEITNFRKQIKRLLRDSPSLKPFLESIIDECYQDGKEIASQKMGIDINIFPEKSMANLEQILDENWLF